MQQRRRSRKEEAEPLLGDDEGDGDAATRGEAVAEAEHGVDVASAREWDCNYVVEIG